MQNITLHGVTAPGKRLLALIVLANLFVLLLLAWLAVADYQQILQRSETRSRTLNALVAEGVAAEINRVELGLEACVAALSHQGTERKQDIAAFSQLMNRVQQRLPMLANMFVTDDRGQIIYNTLHPGNRLVSLADRAYFSTLRKQAAPGMLISSITVGRVIGKPVLIFARRLERPDGSFAGIVAATVRIAWFEHQFSQIDVDEHGAVVLRGDASRNFDLLARFRPVANLGQTKVSDTFRATITAHPDIGTYQAYAGADDIHRTFTYQKLHGYPLITLIGLASQDYLRDWWRDAAIFLALELGFLLMTGYGGRMVLKAWQKHEAASRQVKLLLECAGSGIFGIDTQGICTFVNPAAVSMLGMPNEQALLGQAIHAIIHHHLADGSICQAENCPMLAALHGQAVHADQALFWQGNGSSFPVEFWARPQYDGDGLLGVVVTFVDIRERLLANTDSLTQLENRRRFDETLESQWSRHLRAGDDFSLILLDVDFFKQFNDGYGHVAGDECLRQVAAAIRGTLARVDDRAARYGGEEFVCILPSTSHAGALIIASQIRAAIEKLAIEHSYSSVSARLTVSMGVITACGHFQAAARDIVERADQLLYRAKFAGRNRICYATVSAHGLLEDISFIQPDAASQHDGRQG